AGRAANEAGRERRQDKGAEIAGGGDPHRALGTGIELGERRLGLLQRSQRTRGLLEVQPARVGELYRARGPLQQLHPERLLQTSNTPAHARLWQAERPGGGGEALKLHDPEEDRDSVEIHLAGGCRDLEREG